MIKNQVMVKLDVPLTQNKSDALSTKEGRQSGLEKSVLSNTRWRQGLECTTHFSEAFLRQLLAATGQTESSCMLWALCYMTFRFGMVIGQKDNEEHRAGHLKADKYLHIHSLPDAPPLPMWQEQY